jgi:nitrogen fixation NifU-like protein
MTAAVKGKSLQDAQEVFARFHRMVTGRLDPAEAETLGKLAVFSGVSAYPTRVKCASLPWHALKTALLPDTPMT